MQNFVNASAADRFFVVWIPAMNQLVGKGLI